MKSAFAILALVGFNTPRAVSQPSEDVCGDMDFLGTDINGLGCAFCVDPDPPCGQLSCVDTPPCLCPDDDLSNCCKTNPCCDNCPDPKPAQCDLIYCSCDDEACCETICPPPAPEYVLVQGKTSQSKKKMCWEVRNGRVREHNKIVLAKCDSDSEAQQFVPTPVPSDASGVSVKLHPKLNPEKVIVGVREAEEKGWLRIEDNDESPDQTQIFTALEDGTVRLGNNMGVQYLYVTNQGLTADKGDPVMLTTGARLEHFKKHGDVINTWKFV